MTKKPRGPGTSVMVNRASVWNSKDEPDWRDCVVTELLGTQFTYETEEGATGFCFYAHYGDTWREETI